ncbi:Glutamate receptor [Portunus trituberculatus]|uniref:Glutamate receptor n=1 Tax=Portunus trituberculatus TaxID=210409 RepID=A0A5B7K6L2_PORTR|nr:Glutamate receptor [Portunus trituberculatus]
MDFVVPSDQQYGNRLENGTWTGIIAQVASREVDMSAVPVIINANRNKVVDPGFPLLSDPVVLSYIRPVQRADLAGFVKPFTFQCTRSSGQRARSVVESIAVDGDRPSSSR